MLARQSSLIDDRGPMKDAVLMEVDDISEQGYPWVFAYTRTYTHTKIYWNDNYIKLIAYNSKLFFHHCIFYSHTELICFLDINTYF